MTSATIPAKTVITCDCCQRVCGAGPGQTYRGAQEGGLTIHRHALDFQGCAVANGSVKLDLCDSCLSALTTAINSTCDSIRARLSIGAAHGAQEGGSK